MEERLMENRSGILWFMDAMQKSMTIEGRSRRREYWWFQLFISIIGLSLALIPLVTLGVAGLYSIEATIQSTYYLLFAPAIFFSLLFIGFVLMTIVPGLSVLIRRMHDHDMPGWVILVELLPLGEFAILYFCLRNGTIGQNRYGHDPKMWACHEANSSVKHELNISPDGEAISESPIKYPGFTNLLSFLSPVYGFILAHSFRKEHKSVSSKLSKWSVAGMIITILITLGITGGLYLDAKETDNLLSAKAASILEGDEYYYEGVFYDGSDMDGDTLGMAAKEDDFVFVFYDTSGQEYARVAGFEGFGYAFDVDQGTYVSFSDYDDVTYAYPDLTYEKSGEAKLDLLRGINDSELKYEEYTYMSGTDEAIVRFYFQNDKLYCMEESFTDTDGYEVSEVVVITELKDSVPLEWFEVDGVN